MEYLFTFENTHEAIFAEKVLLTQKVAVRVMSLPAQIAAGCGICLRVNPNQLKMAKLLMQQNNIPYQAVYSAKKNKMGTEYTQCSK